MTNLSRYTLLKQPSGFVSNERASIGFVVQLTGRIQVQPARRLFIVNRELERQCPQTGCLISVRLHSRVCRLGMSPSRVSKSESSYQWLAFSAGTIDMREGNPRCRAWDRLMSPVGVAGETEGAGENCCPQLGRRISVRSTSSVTYLR